MDYQSIITFFMEMAGTVAFAASGAMVGVERNMDIFGVSVLGVVTAVGGGMIRDIVLGIIPPNVFTNPVYALVATITSCVVFLVFYWKRQLLEGHMRLTYDRVMLVMDSIGLGIFTVHSLFPDISFVDFEIPEVLFLYSPSKSSPENSPSVPDLFQE